MCQTHNIRGLSRTHFQNHSQKILSYKQSWVDGHWLGFQHKRSDERWAYEDQHKERERGGGRVSLESIRRSVASSSANVRWSQRNHTINIEWNASHDFLLNVICLVISFRSYFSFHKFKCVDFLRMYDPDSVHLTQTWIRLSELK